MLIVLSFDKNDLYTEKNCILALLLGGVVPDSARDIPMIRHPPRITSSSPSLSQTGGSSRSIVRVPTSTSSAALFHPSFNSHLATSTEPSRASFPSSPTQFVVQTRTFTFPAAMTPHPRLTQYPAAQPGDICGPHCAEHIRRRQRRWTGLRGTQTEHRLHRSGHTGSGQPHDTEKGRFLGGTTRGSNAVASNSSSGNGNYHRGHDATRAKEVNVRTAVFNSILVGLVAGFWPERTDHNLFYFFVAFRV